jgi:hypothetical protein
VSHSSDSTSAVTADVRPVEWLVIGAGPCALAALEQLLDDGISETDVVVLAPVGGVAPAGELAQATVLSSYSSARRVGALGKAVGGESLSLREVATQGSLSAHWGASCLPLAVPHAGSAEPAFLRSYESTVRSWNVAAEEDGLASIYPLTGEHVGDLPRKAMAVEIVAGAGGSARIGHSRLAVSGRSPDGTGCSGLSLCFHGCPVQAPWGSASALDRLREARPGLRLVNAVAGGLRGEGDLIAVDVAGSTLRTRRLLVAAGWRSTVELLAGREPRLGASAELEQSSVVMAPIVLRAAVSNPDFEQSFTFHDLVVPHLDQAGRLVALTQIYLPTHELAGRVLATAPSVLDAAIRAALRAQTTARGLRALLRHVGVAMTFFPGTTDWSSDACLQEWRGIVPSDVNNSLRGVGGRVVGMRKVLLNHGQSQHVGAWSPYRDVGNQLLHGSRLILPAVASVQGRGRVAAADPTILPFLPPGPHTASAAAIGRLLVSRLVEEWS